MELGLKGYAAAQVFKWIYGKLVLDIDQWTDISRGNHLLLKKKFNLGLNPVLDLREDGEGNKKFLLELKDKNRIEHVLLKEKDHYTFCLSTQVGCPLGCVFCATGRMGFVRNLSSGEMISQVLVMKKALHPGYRGKINLVFMGMGEPLLNYPNLKKALHVITSEEGLNISPRSITVSTAGILDKIDRLERDFPRLKLSVSLNATSQESREKLMPGAGKEKLADLLNYFRTTAGRRKHRVTFEYVLLQGINDQEEDAVRLARILKSIRCKINLIPYNDNDLSFRAPPEEGVETFARWLREKNYTVMIRWSKGRELRSACGQLATGKGRKCG